MVMEYIAALVLLEAIISFKLLWNFPKLPPAGKIQYYPMVSIIVPVRNEIDNIKLCMESILNLDYPNKEIIAVDGSSTDGTYEYLKTLKGIKLIHEESLPSGWVGKNYACFLGYKASKGEFLLFTDGDTTHHKDLLKNSISYSMEQKVGLLTLGPKLFYRVFSEKIILPFIVGVITTLSGGKKVNDDNSGSWMADGQYMLFDRNAYEKIGGHEKVKGNMIEDVSLAGLIKTSGLRLRVLTAQNYFETRMHQNFSELLESWTKNFYAFTNHRPAKAALILLYVSVFYLLPAAVFILSFGSSIWAGVAYIISLGKMAAIYKGLRSKARYSPLYPIAALVYFFAGLTSTLRGIFGLGAHWKGRVYSSEKVQFSP
ncbi:MAG: glycosyltransferase [Candidatus Aenigmarchaeota archaeon]|nr:glycosyltransferase [Candidatus Aenigmarchaeota archaeon]